MTFLAFNIKLKYTKHEIQNNFFCRLLFIVIVAVLTSCVGNGNNEKNEKKRPHKPNEEQEEIILGEKMNDPYDMKFMSKAFAKLNKKKDDFPFTELSPTGIYVRLLAESTKELDEIESDTTMLWFDFPLDYELLEGGITYHDPSLPDSVVWKYAVVPVDYKFPEGIKKEILYYVFIPDDHPEYKKYEKSFDKLEELSLKLCKKEKKAVSNGNVKGSKGKKWAPSATIRAWDDVVQGLIPLEGVKVTARHYTKCRSGITNAQGKYTFAAEFKKGHRVKYGITWERAYWDIRDGLWLQAYYNGPQQERAWNLNIYGQKSLMYATIHRAALKAFYGYFGGIQRPYATHSLKIAYINSSGSSYGDNICFFNLFGILQNIRIWGYNNGQRRTTDLIFGTTIHEMAHQSQLKHNPATFYLSNLFIQESWARCVQWYITNHHYNVDLGIAGYNHQDGFQKWTRSDTYDGGKPYPYTPVFIDLIDNINQYEQNPNRCKDNISGYTLIEIQNNLLDESFNLKLLRNDLKRNLLHGTTAADVDELLDNYLKLGF